MQKARLKRLLHQYFNNIISSADCIELLDYLNTTDSGELNELIDIELSAMKAGPEFKGQQSQEVLNRIKSDLRFSKASEEQKDIQPKIIKFYQKRRVQLAAAVLIFCTAGLVIFNKQNVKTRGTIAKITKPAIIVPGSNRAILTIAGGKTIVLDSASNGVLVKTNGGKVLKTHNEQIIYKAAPAALVNLTASAISYNTLSTPRGGEYQVVLPDGTKVWLDAASSITYPVAFNGNDRRVKLTGQAYFEVAKNKEKPFYVRMNKVEVRVLGTHFNISAYKDDDEITTTLLEGSVQVTKNNTLSLLKPGQQAVVGNSSDKIAVSEANIDDAMAWKNGYFIFNDDNVTGIMKKVSRWYDVDVEYRGNFDDQQFGGTFYRTKSLTELLQHLEKIGKIHFTISGRRVIVMD
jgi:transmembrane sensor